MSHSLCRDCDNLFVENSPYFVYVVHILQQQEASLVFGSTNAKRALST